MDRQRYWIQDKFFGGAKVLRREFEGVFGMADLAKPARFVWDFWSIQGQYKHLRAQPESVFSADSLANFYAHLEKWGLKNLGCSQVSPVWLSAYTEGCFQKLHADFPHGPWAFVYSLTPEEFKGAGRTMLAKDSLVDLWASFDSLENFHEADFFEYISPDFNRLVVFDPRLPHAVERVENALGVLEGRLVLHGWFLPPQPVIQGELSEKTFGDALSKGLGDCQEAFISYPKLHGLLSFEFVVSRAGRVTRLKILSNTLINRADPTESLSPLIELVTEKISGMTFKSQKEPSKCVLPLVFE
ncbi:hypothetical protein GW915_13430 [bacterium]|nr:hypothetical protein [bacterium]